MPALKILMIGGTGFVGRHLTEAALARGHQIWLFNRGQSAPGLFPQCTTIFGDRDNDLARLREGSLGAVTWDAVIDTNARRPVQISASLDALRGRAAHYLFISSISAYRDLGTARVDESSPLSELPAALWDDRTMDTYGQRKAACEGILKASWPGTSLVARPGLIVGPHDPTDRYTYWPVRLARGDDFVAPGSPTDRVRFVDVRDLAEWMVGAVERQLSGTYNVVGPAAHYTIGELIADCRAAVGSERGTAHWIPADFLASHGVAGWSDLPVWYPGFGDLVCERAVATGLRWRSPQATARDTLAWFNGAGRALSGGLSTAREAVLLAAWQAHQRGQRQGVRHDK